MTARTTTVAPLLLPYGDCLLVSACLGRVFSGIDAPSLLQSYDTAARKTQSIRLDGVQPVAVRQTKALFAQDAPFWAFLSVKTR